MTLRHLRIFVEVATTKTMSRAADNLHISQPTVSQVIAELEKVYETKLFERFSKELKITESGQLLLRYATQTLQAKESLEQAMRRHNDMDLIKIGGTVTVGACVLNELAHKVTHDYPNINVYLYINNTGMIERKLLSNGLDIALVEGVIRSKDIMTRPLIADELVFLCSSKDPFVCESVVSLAQVCQRPFILRERGSGTRARFEEVINDEGLSLTIRGEYNNTEAIKNAVYQGLGLSVMSRRLAQDEVASGKLHVLSVPGVCMRRFFSLAWHRNKYLSESLQAFIAIAESFSELEYQEVKK